MAFARVERHECSGLAFDGLARGVDGDAAGDHLHDCTLAHVVVGKVLSAAQVECDEPALG
jgi:hypothetical protein